MKSIIGFYRKLMTLNIKRYSEIVPTLPPNLVMNDTRVFEKPVEPNIQPLEYLFPTLNIPRSIEVKVFDKSNESVGHVELDPDIFGVAIRKDIILECIRHTRHRLRQPKKTKRMSEIRGSNKKPRPQKGLGRSQVGHRRNSVWRGGQKAHGPVIRDYSIGLNKKMRAKGMMIALAAKFREGNLIVFDRMECEVYHNYSIRFNSL
jgi:large subunit ribosomal protein L4